MSIFMPLVTTLSLQCITTAEASKVFKFYGGEGCGVLEPFRILDRPQIDEPASKCTILESFSNQLTEQEINYIEEGIEPNEGWSEWNMWSQCTSTCGSGTKFRTRMCEEGKDCVGSTRHIKYCNPVFCPIDGGWGEWTSWGECSGTCGTTTMSRNRECSNPPMKHNGKPCPGQMKEFQQCEFLGPCPIHGAWTDWSSWTPCTKSCDSGLQSRNRSCSNPAPAFNGRTCQGTANWTQACATDPCPIDGAWTTWSVWSSCTATCGPSNQARTRSCTNPEPQYGGIDCSGDTIESIICPTDPCPVVYPPCCNTKTNVGRLTSEAHCDCVCLGNQMNTFNWNDESKDCFCGTTSCEGQCGFQFEGPFTRGETTCDEF